MSHGNSNASARVEYFARIFMAKGSPEAIGDFGRIISLRIFRTCIDGKVAAILKCRKEKDCERTASGTHIAAARYTDATARGTNRRFPGSFAGYNGLFTVCSGCTSCTRKYDHESVVCQLDLSTFLVPRQEVLLLLGG